MNEHIPNYIWCSNGIESSLKSSMGDITNAVGLLEQLCHLKEPLKHQYD